MILLMAAWTQEKGATCDLVVDSVMRRQSMILQLDLLCRRCDKVVCRLLLLLLRGLAEITLERLGLEVLLLLLLLGLVLDAASDRAALVLADAMTGVNRR